MDALVEIANRAIADYGFRQVVLWSPDDVIERWKLPPGQAEILHGTVVRALEALPIPVEPKDIPDEQARLAELIRAASEGPH